MVTINSFSSGLMLGNTLYRNQMGLSNKLLGQTGYALIAVVAVIETIVASCFSLLSLAAYPFSSTPFMLSTTWLGSSAFSFGWSITDFALNLFSGILVADEQSARQILSSGNLTFIPPTALIII